MARTHTQGQSPPREPAPASVQAQGFGPFLLYERVGVGGRATVHRARRRLAKPGHPPDLCIKRLLPHLRSDPKERQRFIVEARLSATMNHPHMCRFYELGRVDGEDFIAVEYIAGNNLSRLLNQAYRSHRPAPLGVALGITLQICDALAYAHAATDVASGAPLSFVHRDLAPTNIMVAHTGQVKVIDLGDATARTSSIKVDAGEVRGSLGYQSPEAYLRQPVDYRADIYSAGVLLHEMLTARPLFGTNPQAESDRRGQRVLPPSTTNDKCTEQIDALVMRALQRRRADRWQSAASFRSAIATAARAYGWDTSATAVAVWASSQAADQRASGPLAIDGDVTTAVRDVAGPPRIARGTDAPIFAAPTAPKPPELTPPQSPPPSPVLLAPAPPQPNHPLKPFAAGIGVGGLLGILAASLWPSGGNAPGPLPIAAVAAPADAPATAKLRPDANTDNALAAANAATAASASATAPSNITATRTAPATVRSTVAAAPPDSALPAYTVDAAPPAPPPPSGPAHVHEAEVERLTGDPPRSGSSKALYSARICIDQQGKVDSVQVLEGPQRLHGRIKRALRRWQYEPYVRNGQAVDACFVITENIARKE